MRRISKLTVVGTALLGGMVVLAGFNVLAAENFRRLNGAQIRAALAGMEVSDEVHWAEVYQRSGTLLSYSMSKKDTGKWRVEKDELCVDRGRDDAGCYQVWMSGKKVEQRREGSNLPLEGILRKPIPRP